ncbi:hypothetical protein GH975_08835 [Litorivicinus lipolyticus]|jgi:hypothetical protein|uniref:Uncharacterized protein n=1 Tax=Litorivicinus lipolyticus TaxID=418701 RepID=A0A5Q2QF57_9GAMM|nr:hypothetical protein [Litorivicinus lipolyticus]QGG80666.1 hypothetical protein GH975_08835 [Litorivicinus lipolyticus]
MNNNDRDFVSLPLECEQALADERERQKPFLRPSVLVAILVAVAAIGAYVSSR